MPTIQTITNASGSFPYVPSSRTLTINGVSYDLTADRSWTISTSGTGTVTSVGLSATMPTGLVATISGSPITSNGTLGLTVTMQSGYAIPTTAKQSEWDSAYTNRITSLTTTGNSGAATLISNTLNIPNYTLAGLGGVSGSGTTNYVTKFTGSSTIGNSQIIDNGTNVGIGVTPTYKLHVQGTGFFNDNVRFPNTKGLLFENSSSSAVGSIKMNFGVTNPLEITNGTNTITLATLGAFISSNLLVGATTIGTSATNTIALVNGTAPSSSATDIFHLYSADVTAGNAAPHFRTENGAVIKIYQETTGVGNSIFLQGGGNSVLDDSTFDGYTLRQIVKALRNQGILQ